MILISSTFAFSEESEKSKERIGPGKAVVAANEKDGFQLSEKAKKNLNLSLAPVTSRKVIIATNALITFQDFFGVYRLRDGWFRLVEVEPVINDQQTSIILNDFKPGDQLVIYNGGLLRAVELDIFGPEADACAD